ncbi:unnamed protein product [Cylicocyclus nassatus]|uniref:Uncharacterized protein n=1 Tax=Cylicocyclus nassatus TaxID=53992 RepID=A0AA36MFK7_CYLNA|nr:unnamed protein product [Cylicocyclus nassatus]
MGEGRVEGSRKVALFHAYLAFTLFLSFVTTCSKVRNSSRKAAGATLRPVKAPQKPKNKQCLPKEAKTQQASAPMKSDDTEQGVQVIKKQEKNKKENVKEIKVVQPRKEKTKNPVSMNEGTPIDAHQLELLNEAQNMEHSKNTDYVNPDLCFDDVISEKNK